MSTKLTNILIDKLIARCCMGIAEYQEQARNSYNAKLWDTDDGALIHYDNGSDILAVGHMDYVGWQMPKLTANRINCEQLDDRLGIWAFMDYLPEHGITMDYLLTDSEEVGRSTAQWFDKEDAQWLTKTKKYRWVVEFDRMGSDCVTYQYRGKNWRNAIGQHRPLGHGSFSDIAYMEQLEIQCVNWAIGYHRQHSPDCYAHFSEVTDNLDAFAGFHAANESKRYAHSLETKKEPVLWYNDADDSFEASDMKCESCWEPLSDVENVGDEKFPLCETCRHWFESEGLTV